MSGERSAYFIDVAERGAQRVVERLALVADRYGAPINPADDVITFAEMMQHYNLRGHMPGSADECTEKICERARAMVAGALAALAAQSAQPQGAQ